MFDYKNLEQTNVSIEFPEIPYNSKYVDMPKNEIKKIKTQDYIENKNKRDQMVYRNDIGVIFVDLNGNAGVFSNKRLREIKKETDTDIKTLKPLVPKIRELMFNYNVQDENSMGYNLMSYKKIFDKVFDMKKNVMFKVGDFTLKTDYAYLKGMSLGSNFYPFFADNLTKKDKKILGVVDRIYVVDTELKGAVSDMIYYIEECIENVNK